MDRKPDYQGKVRDIYQLEDKLIIVSKDRISAFDVVFNELIPQKGFFLNQISLLWFNYFQKIQNHLLQTDLSNFPPPYNQEMDWSSRSVLVKKCNRIDYECVVRGFLFGSVYEEYKQKQTIAEKPYPKGLKCGDKLQEPIFTPAIKSDKGHDQNISELEMQNRVGKEVFAKLKQISLYLYNQAASLVESQNLLLFDTKFEFGFDDKNQIVLIDELLTPDSSRYIDKTSYENGQIENLDKQVLRDYLLKINWDKSSPPPKLPNDLILKITEKYKLIYERLKKCLPQKSTLH